MHTLYPPRDWLRTLPELEAPSAEEIQLEIDLMAGSNGSGDRFADDEWADCCAA